ncbi:hypothetical protein JCM8547_000438 [Rhodosporidiobolus lusitaniae]
MTAVSRPPHYTSDSVFTPLSPLGSPSSHPPTPAHLLPNKAPPTPAQPTPATAARNHLRATHPAKAAAIEKGAVTPPPPPRPPRPLARPSQGYPFPLMLSRQNTGVNANARPSRLPSANTVAQRAMANANDGWGTPSSSTASSPVTGGEAPSSSSAPSSAFSDSSSIVSTSSNSSAGPSTPLDEPADGVGVSPSDDLEPGARRLSIEKPSPPAHIDVANPLSRTPAAVAHARSKHAGSTPGAPPPAPLVQLESVTEGEKTTQPSWDDIEAEDEDAEKTPPSLAPTPADAPGGEVKRRNPLAGGFRGLGMSKSSEGKKEAGVGSKVEVD